MKKKCNECEKHITITNKSHKTSWNDLPSCRECKYIMDIFSLNGNRLKEY